MSVEQTWLGVRIRGEACMSHPRLYLSLLLQQHLSILQNFLWCGRMAVTFQPKPL